MFLCLQLRILFVTNDNRMGIWNVMDLNLWKEDSRKVMTNLPLCDWLAKRGLLPRENFSRHANPHRNRWLEENSSRALFDGTATLPFIILVHRSPQQRYSESSYFATTWKDLAIQPFAPCSFMPPSALFRQFNNSAASWNRKPLMFSYYQRWLLTVAIPQMIIHRHQQRLRQPQRHWRGARL